MEFIDFLIRIMSLIGSLSLVAYYILHYLEWDNHYKNVTVINLTITEYSAISFASTATGAHTDQDDLINAKYIPINVGNWKYERDIRILAGCRSAKD